MSPLDQLFSCYWYYTWQVHLSLESAEGELEEVVSATSLYFSALLVGTAFHCSEFVL